MSVSREYLERCANDTGFQVAALEKVVRLGDLAGDIGRHPLLRDALALKGGTALNLGFGAPRRMSVDLDLNHVGAVEREAMLADRPGVERAVEDLARRAGYGVQRSADAFAGRKLYLSFQSVLGGVDRIQVDLNFAFRVPLGEGSRRELWQPGELDRPSLTVVSDEELVSGKLLALLDRCAARDAWDVANLPEEIADVLSNPHFRPLFVAISGILDHPLTAYRCDRIDERLTQRTVDELLRPMLVAGTPVDAAELAERTWRRIENLLDLSAAERQYAEDLQYGRLRTELLFDDPAEAERMARHPALL